MTVEKRRLLSLIEFSQQSARLRGKPAAAISSHGLLALFEHEIHGLPGIRLNAGGPDTADEVWCAVERLHETRPPAIADQLLRPWVQLGPSPAEEPQLRGVIETRSLFADGQSEPTVGSLLDGQESRRADAVVRFDDYERSGTVRVRFDAYLAGKWRPWANEESRRRKTIRLYAQLFTLKQQLDGGIVEAQLELVWGVGVGVWRNGNTTLSYPLIGQLVEMALNPVTAEIEIRPRDVDARIEIDWYASVDNPGVPALEKAAKEFFGKAAATFSPFDRGTFEPLLQTAVAHLDGNGIYWPNEKPAEDRAVPKADERLKVTDTWVLFARPRTNNLFLQDLEKLKARVEDADSYPPAVAAVVTDLEETNEVVELPSFRGVSASYHAHGEAGNTKARDVYFPKPFNEEQFRIVQLLEVSDGVVVQGPPGTGKTHTIANVICHYLASGKRVLVTSMKDPALREVQEKLPGEIRQLAISLLTSEQEGMKQFEHAIQEIAAGVQGLDRHAYARAISRLEESIDALHGKLSRIDHEVGDWAKRNLSKITLEGEQIEAQDAARKVVASLQDFEIIPDLLGIAPEFAPKFSDEEISRLREARRTLGPDISYLDASLPQLVEFADSRTLLEVHQDLSQFEKLRQAVDRGDIPAIANSSQETVALARQLLVDLESLRSLLAEIEQANSSWTTALRIRLRQKATENLTPMLEVLGGELLRAVAHRASLLERPVDAPDGAELDGELIEAVKNLIDGRSPFGLRGLVGKGEQKRRLNAIRMLGRAPADAADWAHVDTYLAMLKTLRELAVRWNALASEFQIDSVPVDDPRGGLLAAKAYGLYVKVRTLVASENALAAAVPAVFPGWPYSAELTTDAARRAELETALRHHLTKDRLANVWIEKERLQKTLDGRTGRVIDEIRHFLTETLGNPLIEDAQMQSAWSALMAELSRVLGLATPLATVRTVCDTIEESGASQFAGLLKQPVSSTTDPLLPSDLRRIWRLRRLATHLESIDAHENLKRLARSRRETEGDLSLAYSEIVVKRTWLKLAENASPPIRAALQAYLNAIQKIGKGTGKRAVRYRQDARLAASQANPAVPCWIMPHYRVSESLPAELGCFDLVVIDEASQSDFTALPSLLRARKVLIVGDDKQVSPEGVGLEEEKVRSLMGRFLGDQVETFRPQMSPERSIYDLFKVVFAKSSVMLKEHFRCVGPIIEYSKREFYNHQLRPLRLPKASERLDPPLVDVIVRDGYRDGDVNLQEARFIVDEIKSIAADPAMENRSIGVVSLLGNKQALEIWNRLTAEIGPELMRRHRIECGDARTFQGKERSIMFLSMVSAPNQIGASLSRDTFEQRFNVAASRAQDRMYLVRSVELENLSTADLLRRALIGHFSSPFAQNEVRVEDLRKLCESDFEREVYDELTGRGYWVTPQVRVGPYRIDMVVEGHNDARLAVECDGDKYHGPDKWADDMQRQRELERANWVFWRCFASAFVRRRAAVVDDLVKTLSERGIDPIGAEGAPRSVHTEQRIVSYS